MVDIRMPARCIIGASSRLLPALLLGGFMHVGVAQDAAVFQTPEAAVEVLLEAVRNDDDNTLLELFGKENEDLVIQTDKAESRAVRAEFVQHAEEMYALREVSANEMTLVIGREAWPLPVPLVKGETGWSFDATTGREEILDRRVGRHEFGAIGVCLTYIDAQLEYASADRDGDGVLEYAQRLGSSPGRRDGLYWDTAPGEALSPFGPLVAEAGRYLEGREPGDPYRGYYYRILTAQGENPPVGAYDYVINGHMIAGFGLIAYPADYGSSGIMTFMCSHHGKVYQKDLGEDTPSVAAELSLYDPDETWELAGER